MADNPTQSASMALKLKQIELSKKNGKKSEPGAKVLPSKKR